MINDVVFAELSVRYACIEDLNEFVAEAGLDMAALPRDALSLAGNAFAHDRKAGGRRTGVVPDFFIGAHAAVRLLPPPDPGWRPLPALFSDA